MVTVSRFPVLVDHAIHAMLGERPERIAARTPEERASRRASQLSRIRFLEDYFISQMSAWVGLTLAWEERAPFCLFLRSYEMGHHAGREEDPSVRYDPTAPHFLVTSEPAGGRLLRRVDAALRERAFLLAIANPDEWLPHRLVDGPFANVVIAHASWRARVRALIPAARLIVIHRSGSSEGVNFELDQIRAAACEDRTIIVREPQAAPPADAGPLPLLVSKLLARDRARQAARSGQAVFPDDPALAGWPHVLEWRDDETLERDLGRRMDMVLKSAVTRRFGPLPALEPDFGDAAQMERSGQDARTCHIAAGRMLKAGEANIAEELLFECYGLCCLANDVGGRASACLELGRYLLLRVWDASSARTPLEYASGHFLQMASGETPMAGAAGYAMEALHLHAAALLLDGETDAATAVLEVAGKSEPTPRERKWQQAMWDRVREHAASEHVARFVARIPAAASSVLERFEPRQPASG